MRTLRAVVVGAGLAGAALAWPTSPAPAAGQPTVKCTEGATLLLQQGVRVFRVPQRIDGALDGRGKADYACRGRRGRPIRVGENYTDDRNQGDQVTRAFAFSGPRYLGVTSDYNGGEACGQRDYILRDVRSPRFVHSYGGDCAFAEYTDTDEIVVTPRGAMAVISYDDVLAFGPGRGARRRRLSTVAEDLVVSDIAARGELVYWTETPKGGAPAVRSSVIGPGPGAGSESQSFQTSRLPRRTGACARGGTTVARSVLVRVVDRTAGGSTRRTACRITGSVAVELPSGDLEDLQIAADRWVLALERSNATLIDVSGDRSGAVALPDGATFRQVTLLDDGTFAWLESTGRLVAQPPGGSPTVLADAAAAPSALASSGSTIYWTQADGPKRASAPAS